ncbi:hypothetical protein EN864_24185 [bacterium M00.F.Ca.ET.221.01.1.1]|uniref:hypothetical protein n=1 Tax=Mesorhizobium sp. M2D.F.Ca.ET.223.01.1.1 TaxID=2563940 RepID=UPI0010932068|nr:hypothetical protein [Mesorhizobium sp. M2D.F.Ca.ET.223.01.1.1]TGP86398.1 hypothetical protein EN864_24185 [bacterium M00.F.Ca.ET.221.01.1.1]
MNALRERRGPLDRDREPEDFDEASRAPGRKEKKAALKTQTPLATFEKVLEVMLARGASSGTTLRALDLTSYVCDRLRDDIAPAKAEQWLRRIVDAICAASPPEPRLDDVAPAIMALYGTDTEARATWSPKLHAV